MDYIGNSQDERLPTVYDSLDVIDTANAFSDGYSICAPHIQTAPDIFQDLEYSGYDDVPLGRMPSMVVRKPSFHLLPQLSIPRKERSRDYLLAETSETPSTPATPATPVTPATPASLSSPIVGVVDLTKCVKTLSPSPLTHGGFSDIYMGEWEREVQDEGKPKEVQRIQVAIKLLRMLATSEQAGVKARKRLNREVYVWHRLEHSNIVRLFGTSYHMGGRPAMVMQWYDNGSAAEYLQKHPLSDRMMLILDVARGLKYLHTLKPPIVHGDLKGNNILITDEGHAVLSDFGLSQVIEDLVGPTGNTPSNPVVGPVRWQAPELLLDEACRPTHPSDVWSFACTAFELLTGQIPYSHRLRDYMVSQDILNGVKPPGPNSNTLECQVHKDMWALLDACWSLNPNERPSMTEVESWLEECIFLT